MTQYVQLSADGTKVIAWYGCPQAITADKPGYAAIADNDARYLAWQNAQTASAAASALIAGGLTISSTSAPALDGVYGTGRQDEINVTGLQVAVANNVFPGFYRDAAGNKHTMTGPQFTTVATAILNFIVAVEEALEAVLAGDAWVAPPSAVTIA